MSISRIKTIVIFILIIVNVCFMIIYIMDRYDSMAMDNQTKIGIVEFLAKNGIDIEDDAIANESRSAVYSIERDIEMEQKLVESVLGEVKAFDQGGNVYQYRNGNGIAEFRSTGTFKIIINRYPIGNKSASKLSDELLNMMEIEAIRDRSEVSRSDEIIKVGYNCIFEGNEVFNCKINFSYSYDGSVEISGTKIVGTTSYLRQAETMTPATALVSFLNKTGDVDGLSKINSMDMGYMMSDNASELLPIWRIITNCGYFYIDATSGEMKAI